MRLISADEAYKAITDMYTGIALNVEQIWELMNNA